MDHVGRLRAPLQTLAFKWQSRPSVVFVSRVLWTLAACVLVGAGGGCSTLQGVRDYVQYNDCTDDFVVGWRNYVWSNKAWHAHKAQYACEAQLHDFGEGFRAGYRDVAAGSNGCPPPLPPRSYWSWKYQSPEGQAKIAAWFAGYPHGAQAAEADCAGNWGQIPVSHVIEQQYAPEFAQAQIPRCDGSCFPQPSNGPVLGPNAQPMDILPTPPGVPNDGSLPRFLPPSDRSPPANGAATRRPASDFPPPMAGRADTVRTAYQLPVPPDEHVVAGTVGSSPWREANGGPWPYPLPPSLGSPVRPDIRPLTAEAATELEGDAADIALDPWTAGFPSRPSEQTQ